MKALDEQIKKIIRLYMMNCGDNENDTIIEIKTLVAKSFVVGFVIGLVLSFLFLATKL